MLKYLILNMTLLKLKSLTNLIEIVVLESLTIKYISIQKKFLVKLFGYSFEQKCLCISVEKYKYKFLNQNNCIRTKTKLFELIGCFYSNNK